MPTDLQNQHIKKEKNEFQMSSLHVEPEEQLATSTTTCAATHYNSSSDKLTFMEGYIRKYIDSDASNKDDYVRYIATLDNIEQLREEAKTLYEKHRQQAARIKKLEFELEMEQGHINILRHGNQSLKKTAIDMSVLTEQEEESISNRLLKHITGLKKEKGELLIQVEQEEEWLTNMLQKKLVQLQKEKIDLENALEQEQEYMVNRLQKQLELLRQQQTSPIPSRHGSSSSSSISASPVVSAGIASPLLGASKKRPTTPTTTSAAATARQLMADPVLPAPPGLVEVLKHELTSLRTRALEMEKEYNHKHQQCNKYKSELIQFRKEYNLPVEDIDDGRVPRVFRAVHVAPNNEKQGRRSASNSSQRSITPTASTSIPPLNLDQFESVFVNSSHSFVSPQSIPGSSTSRSPSVSSSASSSFQRSSISSSRRVSGSLFGLSATPPQHPPQL